MTVSLCKHSFPCQPPHGSIFQPGNCTNCGISYDQVQAELRSQQEALIRSTSRDGECPDCRHQGRLFRWQPAERPWHDADYEPPVTWLCSSCWNGATNADNSLAAALFDAI